MGRGEEKQRSPLPSSPSHWHCVSSACAREPLLHSVAVLSVLFLCLGLSSSPLSFSFFLSLSLSLSSSRMSNHTTIRWFRLRESERESNRSSRKNENQLDTTHSNSCVCVPLRDPQAKCGKNFSQGFSFLRTKIFILPFLTTTKNKRNSLRQCRQRRNDKGKK